MLRKLCFIAVSLCFLIVQMSAQTTSGLMTGEIVDSTGAVVLGAQIDVTNQATGQVRTTTSGSNGIYIVPLLPPGTYTVSVKKHGFAVDERRDVQLGVNQSDTVNFTLGISTSAQIVHVTGAAPLLNTTSATLSQVVDHNTTVNLPLNGREFTQLTLLTPGAAPVQESQQSLFVVSLGAGGISPSVNGQRGIQNNFTMDGILNNEVFTNTWAIAPPPDAIQEFNVQSHITDAQFSISSGANINVVTRSGSNNFHGSVWEFVRNDALNAQTFPATNRLPYIQNQYGVYLGGPVLVPHLFDGRNSTWASGYWEGFRSTLTQTILTSTLTSAMQQGDFSGILGAQVGTDTLGRPEYANEIYDPLTSRPDPGNPGQFLRDPFPGNKIPPLRLNAVTQTILKKYYPAPNLNVAEDVLPNLQFPGNTATNSDVFGIRLDHQFTKNDTVLIRLSRSNQHLVTPESLPTYAHSESNYAQQADLGYTHIFNPTTILQLHYGYTYTNLFYGDDPAGEVFGNSINFLTAAPPHHNIYLGPSIGLSNGYSGVSQVGIPSGPQEGMDYHLDLSKVISHHTLGVGILYYHLRAYDDYFLTSPNFTQNATAQDALPGPTGFGPASFLLGALDSYYTIAGDSGLNQTINWYGLYAQDQWQITKRLAMTFGLRWDYVAPPNIHKIASALDVLTGKFIVTGAVPPYFPKATGPSGYFQPQYNGYEPRFGITYQATSRTVLHGAFAILDDHNNNLIQQDTELAETWPTSNNINLVNLDLSIPTMYIDNLPAASTLVGPNLPPYVSATSANPNNRIPYAMEFNVGVEQQLSNSLVMKLDYVGSLSRFQYIFPTANTALIPGPGPISQRQPFPQAPVLSYSWNDAPGSYNAFQAFLQKSLSSGLLFMASYTWSKSLDWQSDPYSGNSFPNFYDLASNWGPSNYSLTNMFVFSGVYALPIGRGKSLWSSPNRFVQSVAGNWNLGMILSLHSGEHFNALAGADVANVGTSNQRAERTGVSPYAPHQNYSHWLNPAAFVGPAAYTFGNERRNDITGPAYRNLDLSAYKEFPLIKRATLQFRAEFFNALNTTNYGLPDRNLQDAAFGQILSTVGPGREIQFAVKALW